MPIPFISNFFSSKKDDPTLAEQLKLWADTLTFMDVSAAFLVVGAGIYLKHQYNYHQVLEQRKRDLKKDKKNGEIETLEIQTQEAIVNQQSTTLYLMTREAEARVLELKRLNTKFSNPERPLTKDNNFPFAPYDPDASPAAALATSQQSSYNIANYIKEAEQELFSNNKELPSCASKSIKPHR